MNKTELRRELRKLNAECWIADTIPTFFTPELQKSLERYETAATIFSSYPDMWPLNHAFLESNWERPVRARYTVVIVEHHRKETKAIDRNTLVSHMDTLGYRPLTVSEFCGFIAVQYDHLKSISESQRHGVRFVTYSRYVTRLYDRRNHSVVPTMSFEVWTNENGTCHIAYEMTNYPWSRNEGDPWFLFVRK